MLDITFRRRTLALIAGIAAEFIIIMAVRSSEVRMVLYPVGAALAIAATTVVVIWNREGVVPIYDLGCVAAMAVLCYTIIPPLQYVASGMEHTIISAFQFWVLQPTSHEVVALTWRYTGYMAALAVGYLVLSASTPWTSGRPKTAPGDIRFLVAAYLTLVVILFFFKLMYGVTATVSYSGDLLKQNSDALKAMPILAQQIFNIVHTTSFMLKIGLLLALFLNWRNPVARVIFVMWVSATVLGYWFRMGARSELILTMFASMVMYHRFVKPLRFPYVLAGGISLIVIFFFLGIARFVGNVSGYLADLSLDFEYRKALFSMQNEFQVLFAGTYDLSWLKQHGVIQHVPLQFLFYDIVMLLPQQILPFTKIDVQEWYLQQSTAPGFFMYNPVAQSILGFGWIELLLRGVLLGSVFAVIRNWYVRNAGDFWKTLLYSYVVVMCYYGVRGTALYFFAHKLIYTMLPLFLMSRLMIARRSTHAELHPVPAPAAT